MNRSNSTENDIKGKIIDKSNGIKNYFHDLLLTLGKADGNLASNKYLNHLLDFGFSDALFKILDPSSSGIKYTDKNINKLPDLTSFKDLTLLYLNNVKLEDIGESLSNLDYLGVISFPNNNLRTIPKSICYLNELAMLNLSNNEIKKLPDEISNLDTTNGGKLIRLIISENGMSDEYIKKLHQLLPTVDIVSKVEE